MELKSLEGKRDRRQCFGLTVWQDSNWVREAKLATSTISDCHPFMPSLALQGSWASLLFLENPRCHRTQKTLRSQAGETEDLTRHRTQASLASACRFNRQPPGISNRKESLALLSTFLYLPGPSGGTLSSTQAGMLYLRTDFWHLSALYWKQCF